MTTNYITQSECGGYCSAQFDQPSKAPDDYNEVACRTGAIFCVFSANRGESEASANKFPPFVSDSCFALASLSPLFVENT